MRKIRAFCGFEQSGKGYSCKRLMETMGFEKLSFANILRDIAFQTIGVPYNEGMLKYEELKKTKWAQCLRTTGTPCSCWLCRRESFDRKTAKLETRKAVQDAYLDKTAE